MLDIILDINYLSYIEHKCSKASNFTLFKPQKRLPKYTFDS